MLLHRGANVVELLEIGVGKTFGLPCDGKHLPSHIDSVDARFLPVGLPVGMENFLDQGGIE